ARIHEFRAAFDHAHAETDIALFRIVRCDCGNDIEHALAHASKIEHAPLDVEAEMVHLRHCVRASCCGDQAFRGDTPDIEATATHPATLNQHHLRTEGRRRSGHRNTTSAADEDAKGR